MTSATGEDRLARAALGFVADPGDPALGALLRHCPPAEIVAALAAGRHPLNSRPQAAAARWEAGRPDEHGSPRQRDGIRGLDRALQRWGARIGQVPTAARLADWHRDGLRLICPGDAEWPTQLDDLGEASPVALWLRGSADLRFASLRSVSVVGARAATAYGSHVGTEMAAALAERGWAVVSGGAFGIDSAAHRGALAADGVTVAVLASGLSYGYPRSHFELFEAIAAQGVLVSEMPPDRRPTRPGFLIRKSQSRTYAQVKWGM
jgi:DNA processing protein